ncbi:Gfo/Idh/MocA family oxidoreductase [Bacillus sp. CGMCC 1.16541]|uniref:Gfo/Idh/MocA family oxidoreductase n=1 Tax=Bacillus sp. CGMCC 1.16541 TaxID=2185143 RepID=UPI000D728FA9|nr:Gfo/Idh/MocA family oxidoreductase [Bacillus sp. CGMCC 1.16541]
MFNVCIIGGGNIGYRHFEGLLKANVPLRIYVVDPNQEALNKLKNYFEESETKDKTCYLVEHIESLPSNLDLAIIATNSKVRLHVTKELMKNRVVSFIVLEKVLFQKESDYEEMSTLLEEHHVKGCWVNCPLRTFPFFQTLKEKIGEQIITYKVDYRQFGIGCNSIHQLDLFSYLTNSSEMIVTINQLEEVIESKRHGYLEVLGTLNVVNDKGNELVISSHKTSSETYVLKIYLKDEVWTIYPLLETVEVECLRTGEIKTNSIHYPKQSELTTMLATTILLNQTCDLPNYEFSKKLHLLFIRQLNHFFSSQLHQQITECPIT